MTTRTITANTVDLLGVVREGVVYTFRLLSSIATDATPSVIPTDDTQTMTSDANGDSSIALIVPASGAYLYECKLPDGRLVTFGLESGASVDLSTLIADANLDSVTVAGTIATLLASYLAITNNLSDLASAATARTNAGLVSGGAGDIWLERAGDTWAGTQAANDNLLTRPVFKDYSETVNAAGDTGGGAVAIDLEDGNVWTGTVSTAETTFSFTKWPASGTTGSLTMVITNAGAQTTNWTNVLWAGGTQPTFTASGVDIVTLMTVDAGTTIYGFSAGLDMQ